MALPSLTKTWQFNVNNAQTAQGSAIADNRTALLAIKNALIGFGTSPWTVVSSSNSVTASAADNWSTISNIVWANNGSAHSWIVLKQTGIGSNAQLLISCVPGSVSGANLKIQFSPTVGFSGGTNTTDPTASDSIVSSINGNSWTSVTTDAALRWSVMQSTDGQCTVVFIFSGGTLQTFWYVSKFANATTGTPGGTNNGFLYTFAGVAPTLAGVTYQNSIAASCSLSGESVANIGIASEVSGAWDIFPIAVAGTTVGARGRLGTLQDIWVGSSGVAVGDTYPATGSPLAQFVQISNANVLTGGIVLPWNNGAVNLT